MNDSVARMNEAQGNEPLKSIAEAAEALQVTQRTLRFYEDKGLIQPGRVGSMRVYSRREMGRMQLILRGKRLGFSIRDIGEFLSLYDHDPDQVVQAQRMLEEANGYRDEVIARARGEADRFTKLVAEYRKAPEITRERLYIDTMQEVMSNTSKVLVTGDKGQNNLLYLPLDKMIDSRGGASSSSSANSSNTTTRDPAVPLSSDLSQRNLRTREGR